MTYQYSARPPQTFAMSDLHYVLFCNAIFRGFPRCSNTITDVETNAIVPIVQSGILNMLR